MTIAIQSNFFEDIRVQVVDWFAKAGITLREPNDLELVLFAYFSVRRRLIVPRRREVRWSRELRARAMDDPQRTAIEGIAEQSRNGHELTPRQSKSLLDPEFNDGLLDDWDIHHLHLSNKIAPDGFVERDGPLLFVMVRPDALYFIDVRGHGTASFASDELIQIVHDNWPETISGFRAPGAVPGSLNPSKLAPRDRRKARKRFALGWQASDGTVYLAPGGGATTAGLSLQVVSAADQLRERAIAAERWLVESAELVRDQIAKQTGKHLDELRVRLLLRTPLSLLETQSNALIPLTFEPAAPLPIER